MSTTTTTTVTPPSSVVLDRAAAAVGARRRAEVEVLEAALEWAHAHVVTSPADVGDDAAGWRPETIHSLFGKPVTGHVRVYRDADVMSSRGSNPSFS